MIVEFKREEGEGGRGRERVTERERSHKTSHKNIAQMGKAGWLQGIKSQVMETLHNKMTGKIFLKK